jgi:hypothetical protein
MRPTINTTIKCFGGGAAASTIASGGRGGPTVTPGPIKLVKALGRGSVKASTSVLHDFIIRDIECLCLAAHTRRRKRWYSCTPKSPLVDTDIIIDETYTYVIYWQNCLYLWGCSYHLFILTPQNIKKSDFVFSRFCVYEGVRIND